ncbi:AsmA-like C-terminal region-containing protein [Chelativorans sp.]|uniref:AsmA family protein n=1 Tax=Chelativorans sp. TaxID=2203393 RepID=UPI0028117BC0|nr:AsmA-like C-terminal region-containing protein [Chelativorans sp.]
MPVSLARRGVWALGAVALLAILAVAALPLIASTQIVRDSIAYQMSAWSGYRVRLDDTPQIRVWPSFQAVLHDVTLLDWNETNPHIVIEAEQVEMDLSAFAALSGDTVFTRMRLIRPVLRLREEAGRLHLPPPESWGRIARSVSSARAAVANAPAEPDTGALPDDPLGTIEFLEGRIVADAGQEQKSIITSVSGALDWPALNRQASLSANGIWHGETVSLTASTTEPLILLGGGSAPLTFSLEAAPGSASFRGAASFSGSGFVDGQIELATPSLSRLMEWAHARSPVASRIGTFSVSARVLGDAKRLKFEETGLSLDSSAGAGLLDLTFESGRPMIAGTLAFDTLDLRTLFDAFSPLTAAEDTPAGGGGRNIDFDLRFSVGRASFGDATLTNVAAAAKLRDGLAAIDISDAAGFEGAVQFGMRGERTGGGNIVEINMVGEEIDTGKLAGAFGYGRLVPQARGSFSLMLRGTGDDLETVLQTAEGKASAVLGNGSIPGLSIDAFLQHSAAGDFFPLASLGEGALAVDRASVKATIVKGVLQLETAALESGPYTISLDGLVPLAGRGLALYGALAAPAGTDTRFTSPLTFFIGGSWAAPFVASFSSRLPGQ